MSNEAVLADALVLLKDFKTEVPGYKEDFRNEVIKELEGSLRAAANKANGKSGLEAVAKSILKSAKKVKNPALHGAWIAPNGKQYVCDDHTMMEIDDPIELPMLDPGLTHIDQAAIMKDLNWAKEEFKLPSIAELKTGIKEEKAKAKMDGKKLSGVAYYFSGNLAVNAEWLLNAIKTTGAEKLYTSGQKSKGGWIISGLFMTGNGVTMLVLPMAPKCVDAEFVGCKGF